MIMRLILMICFCVITGTTYSQSGDLLVQGVSPDMYLVHSVAPKENWYSIGRIYNISPKEIAPYNHLSMDKPLSIGQQLKIPLGATNFTQSANKAADEVYVPVYHVLQDKEWMFRVSSNYNKVPIENLEKWNGISRDQAKAGMKLIVGYLKVKKELSSLASRGANTMVTGTAQQSGTAATPQPEVVKSEPVVTRTEPARQETPKAVPAEEKRPTAVATPTQVSNVNFNGGYFRSLYEGSGRSSSGSAGIFKSTSGWQDGKYYALMNNVPVGSVVRISNPSTNKAVYAKVLGNLSDMKENSGLAIRISDAAAAELGNDNATARFSVDIKY